MSKPTDSSRLRLFFLSLSVVSLVLCALRSTAPYLKLAWGNPRQPAGCLLGMFFLLLAFAPQLRQFASTLNSLITPRAAFIAVWLLLFVGNGLFYDSAVGSLVSEDYCDQSAFSKPRGFILMGLLRAKPFLITIFGRGFIYLLITFWPILSLELMSRPHEHLS